jgi:antitoxin component YwqK of YwqJK toxin-antitoxin module
MDPRYQSDIPTAAVEHVTATHPDGSRARAEYVLNGEVVGRRFWDADGSLSMEQPLKNGLRHGIEYHWYFNGILTAALPYFEGKEHGAAREWDDSGRLIGTYTMVHGTGIDLWFGPRENGAICLYEARYFKAGDRHGFEWWINADQCTVKQEAHFKEGEPHGIEREWNLKGRLRRGYPRYHVNGRRVTKRQYLAACKRDSSLPPFRAEENEPARRFPPEIERELGPPG